MSQKLGKKIYLDDDHRIVDVSNATCWFADLIDDNGQTKGEAFGLIIGFVNAKAQ